LAIGEPGRGLRSMIVSSGNPGTGQKDRRRLRMADVVCSGLGYIPPRQASCFSVHARRYCGQYIGAIYRRPRLRAKVLKRAMGGVLFNRFGSVLLFARKNDGAIFTGRGRPSRSCCRPWEKTSARTCVCHSCGLRVRAGKTLFRVIRGFARGSGAIHVTIPGLRKFAELIEMPKPCSRGCTTARRRGAAPRSEDILRAASSSQICEMHARWRNCAFDPCTDWARPAVFSPTRAQGFWRRAHPIIRRADLAIRHRYSRFLSRVVGHAAGQDQFNHLPSGVRACWTEDPHFQVLIDTST